MKTFTVWQDAFDYCREANHPVTVNMETGEIDSGKYKLYPSGSAKRLGPTDREVEEAIKQITQEITSPEFQAAFKKWDSDCDKLFKG